VREIAHGFDYSRFRQLYSLDPDLHGLYDEVVANSRAFAQPALSNSVTALRLFAGKNLQSHQRGFPRTAVITSQFFELPALRRNGGSGSRVEARADGRVQQSKRHSSEWAFQDAEDPC
jgi:hypothetical protein